jgi:hypothetical protein
VASDSYDTPEVLRRLDARMLELSHGEIGWDCFTLEYKIAPVMHRRQVLFSANSTRLMRQRKLNTFKY